MLQQPRIRALFSTTAFVTIAFLAGCASNSTGADANARNAQQPAYPTVDLATACPQSAPTVLKRAAAQSPNGVHTETLVAALAPTRTARVLLDEAYQHALDGRRDEAIRLYDLALRFPDNDRPIDRVQWSYGWGMFALQDYGCALARFEAARAASPDAVSWLPQTLAVVYWRLGDKERAIGWYGVAARNLATCWAAPKSVAYCTRHWRPHEQRAVLEVNAAWRAARF
jgi:tetratricopeptide (TPR) repeat protein